jgi:hypothetical protein
MLVGSGLLVIGFLLVFWLLRGFKALKFLFKYKPASVEAPSRQAQ